MKKYKTISALFTTLLMMFAVNFTQATTFGFEKITNNNTVDLTGQLSLDIDSISATEIEFTFYNNVGLDSSLTDIYFDLDDNSIFSGISIVRDSDGFGDPGYNAASSLINTTNVDFKEDAKTPVLPGANGNPINFNSDYDAGAKNVKKGLDNNGEWVTFLAILGGNFTYDNFLDGLIDGSYLIGAKIQSIGDACAAGVNDCANDSSTYMVSTVPVPAAGILFATALFGVGVYGRGKKKPSSNRMIGAFTRAS